MTVIELGSNGIDIVIYENGEEGNFIDDNREEVAIFSHLTGRYLKRWIEGVCDINCPVIRDILGLSQEE